jgi:putative ABC transport system permease protein
VRVARLLAWSSGVVFALAACGVYVLAAQAVQRRAREIVMRKLHGAGRRAIALLLGREFLWLTAAAAVLGLAPAMVAVQRYLAGFADRAPQGWWPVAASLLAAIAVVALAAARHTLSALRIAPATALRD